jgi:prolyl-tRNA synthetase
VARGLGVPAGAVLKAYPIVAEDRGLILVLLRGDHRVNEIKLRNHLREDYRPAREDEISDRIGPPGFIGPVGVNVPILLDDAVGEGGYVTGANRPDTHLRGVEPGRHFPFKRADIRRVEAGDTVDGHPIRIETAIEVGNIFKLGTRYSEPLGASYLDEHGVSHPIVMGSYGIGPARIAAAAVEQFADERGISASAARGARSARWPSGSTASYRRPRSTSSTTTATPARARSSPTPSCSGSRCA